MKSAGEFPAPLEHEYPISDDATRYYKSGKSFLYQHLPFWLASRADRTMVVLVEIEKAVNGIQVPVSFAEQFYVLRQHIIFVRGQLTAGAAVNPLSAGSP